MSLPSLFVVVYILAALHPLMLMLVSSPTPGTAAVYEIGRSLALAAFPIILMQPILTARVPWIDGPVGMANTLRFHKAMGVAALVGLVCHPLCLAFGGAGIGLLFFLGLPWFIIVGKATLALLVIHVLLALFRAKSVMPYVTWKRVHAATAPVILAGAFVHSWYAGTDLALRSLQVYWVVLLTLAATTMVYTRLKGR